MRATIGWTDSELLKSLGFESFIVDEAHNTRRQNLGEGRDAEKPDPNNLLASSTKCPREQKALLLAMATPVQVRPVEAWDLLDILSRGSEAVLGVMWSEWQQAETASEPVMGRVVQ